MPTRRAFLGTLAAAGISSLAAPALAAEPVAGAPSETRADWLRRLDRVAGPVLRNLSAGKLRATMPVEAAADVKDRAKVTHLEAVGRTLAGIAPWLGAAQLGRSEESARAAMNELAVRGLSAITDEASPDRIDFTAGAQNLVDAAFLACGLLQAPNALWEPLDPKAKTRLIAAMQSTRRFTPGQNNWLLFAAMVEVWLASVGAEWKAERVEPALVKHEEWYKGDGLYGDGPAFHWDYYNSFVIHPMLLEVVERLGPQNPKWAAMRAPVLARAVRYAAIQERLIAPDGTYPPVGRSIAYRCGAFHHLAFVATRKQLPEGVTPPQVRDALSAVQRRTLDAPGTFDENGWLRIGLAGHQPGLGETYISTGSLYLCTLAFSPLALPPTDDFWTGPPTPWTQQKLWSGQDGKADHAVK